MLLTNPEKNRDAIIAIKKEIAHMPLELKKTWGNEYYLMNESQLAFIIIGDF